MGDIVETHPEVIETLLDLGVQCVGCHVSPYESLEDGFRGHGMNEDEIQGALQKLNEVIVSNGSSPSLSIEVENAHLTLTDKAAEKIKEFLTKEQKKALRIGVVPGGCSGYKYSMELEDESSPQDFVVEQKGVQLVIGKSSAAKLDGVSIDYVESLQGSGFKIENPHASKSCGCGSSFR